jgi:chitinase
MRCWRGAHAILAILVAGCAALPARSPQYEIVGYYPGWKGRIEVDARQLTVLNYAFLDICWDAQRGNPTEGGLAPCRDVDGNAIAPPNGSVVVVNPAVDRANLAALLALKSANPALKLLASVGGWTLSNRFSDMAANPVTRGNFIESVVAFLRRHRFDGIDIDWEYPASIGVRCAPGHNTCDRATDKDNFVELAKELRGALDAVGVADGKHYLSTIAAGADRSFVFDRSGSSAWLARLAASLDWINLMTYDYHGTWEMGTGFVAPLYRDPADPAPVNADATVRLYLQQGIPASKLTLGQPFYGKGWKGCAAGPRGDGLYQSCAGLADVPEATFEFAHLTERGYLAKDARGKYTVGGLGFTRHWNDFARVPHLYNAATGVFITYDDEASIHAKNDYVVRMGLRGAMFWELNADRHRVLGTVVSRDLPR